MMERTEMVEGLGEVVVRDLGVLTNTAFIMAHPFKLDRLMRARAVKRFLATNPYTKLFCVCRPWEEKEQRFVRFLGFREYSRSDTYVNFVYDKVSV